MTRLVWDDRVYSLGLDRGVFYPRVGPGEVWNGLTSVVESPDGSDEKTRYLDGVKNRVRRQEGYFRGTIEAVSFPEFFWDDVLTYKRPQDFGFCYRVQSGDIYQLHLVYNCQISPVGISHQQSEIDIFRLEFSCRPIQVPDAKRSAHLIVTTAIAYSWTVAALEDVLYGTEAEPPRLPTPQEVFDIFEANSILQIIDHGDGTWTAIGPDSAIIMLDATTFEITWPSAVYIDAESYTIHSL